MILIVDDSKRVRGTLSDLFRGAGYAVQVASDRKSAEALLQSERFVLAVVDYEIPLEDLPTSFPSTAQGRAVMEAASAASVPFVVLTGVAYSWHEAFAAREALDYLDKNEAYHEKLLAHAAALSAAQGSVFPLEVASYAEGNVQQLREEGWVKLWVTGSRRRHKVRVPKALATTLFHMGAAQAAATTCGFEYHASKSARRTSARNLRLWLREHFAPTSPPEHETSPVVADRARGGYYCEVKILDEPDPMDFEQRRAALLEDGSELPPPREDGASDGFQRRRQL